MQPKKVALISGLCLSLTLTASARHQKPPEKPKVPTVEQREAVEDAHEGIFANTVDKGIEASRLTEALAGALPASANVGEIARKNFIDDHIFGRMERDGVPHAPLASDAEFFRRAHLDATGLIPSADAVREFVSSEEPDKRDRLIDSLIGDG